MSEHVSDSAEWQALQGHAEKFSAVHLRDLFGSDPGRGERLTVKVADLTVDYSKNLVTDEVMSAIQALTGQEYVSRYAPRRAEPAADPESPAPPTS